MNLMSHSINRKCYKHVYSNFILEISSLLLRTCFQIATRSYHVQVQVVLEKMVL
ncbi:hypothetical protein CDL12_01741 [Handroanthus impetiginosus]|uniref:Uncharacterized protein n=1 Tax=Handroanthus impetiginosus TaxID=429701 RepID=A0A2G9I6X3_9LAMI|nr:hypothetical protein CDL12_01741 [Handroanthus impetiginosus]